MRFFIIFCVVLGCVDPQVSLAKERISLDFSYDISQQNKAIGKIIVESGQSIEKEIGRGDIDTVVTLTPTLETPGNGKRHISVEVSIKNFRDGDLISESDPEIIALFGKTKKISLKDDTLDENLNLAITAKTVR